MDSLQSYCTELYSVKAVRAIQITHTTVLTHSYSRTNVNAVYTSYISKSHTYSRKKKQKKHLKYRNKGISSFSIVVACKQREQLCQTEGTSTHSDSSKAN